MPHVSIEEARILFKVKTTTNVNFAEGKINIEEIEEKGLLDRNEFFRAFDKSNYGLAKPKLLKFRAEYELLVKLEDDLRAKLRPESDVKTIDTESRDYKEFKRIAGMKVKIESTLIKEILDGYNSTVKQLGLDDKNTIQFDNVRADLS